MKGHGLLKPIVFAAALAALPAAVSAEDVTTTHVAGTVYMIDGVGGNVGASAGPDGVILVDDDMEPVRESLRAAVAKLEGGELRFIINTHFHGDHVGNNEAFGDIATIIAHDNVRRRLTTPQERGGEVVEPLDPAGWPVVTFDRSVSVHFNGEEIRVVHVAAAHTDGDAVVYFSESNVLHAGDVLFSGRFPFVDLDHGGSVDGLVAALGWILEEFPEDARVIPGHGPLSTMDDVRASRDMIVATGDIVRGRMVAGKTLEEIQAEGLPAAYDSFDWRFISTDTWIETLWNAYHE